MRLFLAFLVSVFLIGGMAFYLSNRQAVRHEGEQTAQIQIEETFRLEISTTFTPAADSFYLPSNDINCIKNRPLFEVMLNGQSVKSFRFPPSDGNFVLDDISGLIKGRNEFYIELSPPAKNLIKPFAIKVVLYRGFLKVAEKIFWFDAGERPGMAFPVNIDLKSGSDDEAEK